MAIPSQIYLRGSVAAHVVVLCCFIGGSESFSSSVRAPARGNAMSFAPRLKSRASHASALSLRVKMTVGVPLDSKEFDKGDANPIDSMESLDKLVPRAKITELIKQTSDVEGLLQVAWHVMCYAVCAAGAVVGETLNLRPILLLGVLGMAFVTSFNFMALHETVHRSAFKSRWLNDAVMHIAGFLCLRPATHYFYYHWGHHKYTGNPEKDSELQPSALDMDVSTIPGYLLYISGWVTPLSLISPAVLLITHSILPLALSITSAMTAMWAGLPFWFDAITTTLTHAVGRTQPHEQYLSSPKARADVAGEARVYTLLYVALLALGLAVPAAGAALVKFLVVPSVLGQPMLRFYLFAEHRGCKNTANILENTRGMTTNAFYRKMAWQMPYHLEHHAWPYVPFHKLPAAHALVQAAGGQVQACDPPGSGGYLRLNAAFIRRLLPRPGETAPSGSA